MKIHMVKQGDSLYSIAKKYNVPLEEIVKANPEISNPDAIEVGMKVKIPAQSQSTVGVIHNHIVQQGDTLWKLSKAWGIQLTDIIKLNPQLKNPNALLTGEVVKIPKPPHGAESPMVNMHANSLNGGKANTGVIPSTGAKADTSIQPAPIPMPVAPIEQAPAPEPMPMPEPVPLPAPVPAPAPPVAMPIQDTKPIYGIHIHEHVDLFQQIPIPAVQATAHVELPMTMEHHHHYGYGMQQPQMHEAHGGYGHVQGHEAHGGYGHVQGHEAHPEHGYGHPQFIAPLGGDISGHLGGLYGHNDISYSNGADSANNVPGLFSPTQMNVGTASGCNCGSTPSYLSTYQANAAAMPYAETYPGAGYSDGRVPYGVSPYSVGPYGNVPQAVSPIGNYPGMQASPYYGVPMGDIPVGVSPVAEGIPGVCVDPYHGAHYGALSPIPPVPAMPPIPSIPPLGPLRDDDGNTRSSYDEDQSEVKAISVKKRQAKPKPKLSAVRQSKPKRKESLPWIKW